MDIIVWFFKVFKEAVLLSVDVSGNTVSYRQQDDKFQVSNCTHGNFEIKQIHETWLLLELKYVS